MVNERISKALKYSISIIENYQMDIRNREDLIKDGFCQGIIYKNAVADIYKILGGD